MPCFLKVLGGHWWPGEPAGNAGARGERDKCYRGGPIQLFSTIAC